MSNLINYVRNSPKEDSLDKIIKFWNDTGLIYHFDSDLKNKVAISLHVATNLFIIREDVDIIYKKINGKYVYNDSSEFKTVFLPIVTRVVSAENEAYKYVPEMLGIAYKHMHSAMGLGVINGNESYRKYFYDHRLIPAYSIIGRKIMFASYDQMKESCVDGEELMDWQAEYTLYVSDIVIEKIREYEQ